MLSSASVTTMLPLKDMDRARAFDEGHLGLRPGGFKADRKFVYVVGGSTLALFPKPEGTKADHTAISFRADHIVASIDELERAGVVFEDYDYPELKTVNTSACSEPRRRRGSRTPRATASVSTGPSGVVGRS